MTDRNPIDKKKKKHRNSFGIDFNSRANLTEINKVKIGNRIK